MSKNKRKGKGKEQLEWQFHPLREKPSRGALALALTILCSFWAVKYIESLPLSIPIVAIFLISLRSCFFPITYRLSTDGVLQETPFSRVKRPWESFNGIQLGQDAIRLTRLSRPSLLDRFSALTLYLPKEKRETIIDYVKERVKR